MSNASDFLIEDGVLVKYVGPGGDVVIPEGVTHIERFVFSGCRSLISVTIPEGVTSIGDHAFSGCSSLTSVMIPESVTSIGWGAFSGCSNLTSVTIPEGVASIDSESFSGCGSLTSVTIPEGVTSIGSHAFSRCSSLTSVLIPESVTSIGWGAFSGCSSLTSVTIPENMTSVEGYAFSGCTNLADSNGFVIVFHILFDYCGNSRDVVVPEGVTCINGEVFSGCNSLASVTIPESIMSIGNKVFPNKHIDINISSLAAWCRLIFKDNPFEWSYSDKLGYNLYIKDELVQTIVIPSEITDIGQYAFSRCLSLKNITLSEGVKTIGDKAFQNCSNLENVTLPKSLTSIGWAFYGCDALKTIQFGTVDVTFDSSDHDPFKCNFNNKEFRIILPEDTTYTGKKLPVQLARAARNMSEEELAGVLLFQTSKVWRNEAFAAAKEKDAVRIIEKQLKLIEELKKLSSAAASNALDCFVAFGQVLPEKYVRQFASILEDRKCSKQISALKEDIVLREKLHGNETDSNLPVIEKAFKEIIDANSLTQKQIEDNLNTMMSLKLEDLPELKDTGGNTCNPFVLAWLLTVHEKIAGTRVPYVTASYEKPGICPTAAEILSLLDMKSLQSALLSLADKDLGISGRSKKMFLAYPICRYADEATMAELTKRAPKWRSSVSGNEAPPLLTMRQAAMYNNSRSAMLFAERYHDLEKYAALRGTNADTLRDTVLADFGFDESGRKCYELGSGTVTVSMSPDLKLSLFDDNAGKLVKSIPKKGADPEKYEAAKKDLAQMTKNIKKVVKARSDLLLDAYLSGQAFKADHWFAVYTKNPVLNAVARLLVWSQGDNSFTLSDRGPIDANGKAYSVTDAPIKVAHPMELNSDEVTAWQKYFNAYALKQPFAEIWEPVVDLNSIKEDRYKGCMIPYYRFQGQEKHGIRVIDEDYHAIIDFDFEDCEAWVERIDEGYHSIDVNDRFEIVRFELKENTRQANHIVAYLDRITVWDRIRMDDINVMNLMPCFTLAQITDFIKLAQESNAVNVVALLLDYKNKNFADFDPMDEFTLDLI